MIPVSSTMPTPPLPQQQQTGTAPDPGAFLWVDQFSEEMLLTIQALQRLHTAFDGKFTGGHPDF